VNSRLPPTVTVAPQAAASSPEPTARPIPAPSGGTVNYLFWGAFGLIVVLVIVAAALARSPRR